MIGELEVLKTVAEALDKAGISYMLTGSLATNYYSVPRMTRDIDIVIELRPNDVEKLHDLFKDAFYIDKNMIKDAISHEGMFNIIHNESVIKIDFIIRKDSEYRELEFERKKKVKIEETEMWITSAEDMILSKLSWAKDSHSEMQMKDVRNMINYVKDLDMEYIKVWLGKLGLQQIYNEALNE